MPDAGGDMNQHRWRLAAVILTCSLVSVACASPTASSGGSAAAGLRSPASAVAAATSAASTLRPARAGAGYSCQARALVLGHGPQLSPGTGEHGDIYLLTNRGASACTLAGYPGITLYAADGARLPFHYTHGHSQYVTSAPPGTVFLARGASAYILVAKYRCDLGDDQDAAIIRITIPGPQPATVTGRAVPGAAGVSALTYCRGGPDDPGQFIAVSPIEPARQATFPGLSG
jgi:hypothetical protein